jgi:hypothetical protein
MGETGTTFLWKNLKGINKRMILKWPKINVVFGR